MKKFFYIFIMVLLTLFVMSACSDEDTQEKNITGQIKKDTIMVYMIGSDLESKAGAGTNDLDEMVASGVDLSKVNVVVYAGGAKHWHNENASVETNNIMELTADGFKTVVCAESTSMGEPKSLTDFLKYVNENYKSERYSLIMWDHGDGPVIGYGKDMLFNNDSLTLVEMKNAMEASPFGKDNKLEFVGFDACLMSSAELACTWSDYAKYLISSQEVEPSFGWNYGFLSKMGTDDVMSPIYDISDTYLSSCLEFFERKGYSNRDTTISCMDLSYSDELSSAIDGLFGKAAGDVTEKYDMLVSKRVKTRALGRASTGSEYDLIDLNDMAEQLSSFYPEEAVAVQNVLKKMVVKNTTNAVRCCGVSIFYPFYNKYYYEESWGAAYEELGIFPNYQKYLMNYQDIWLMNDKFNSYASSLAPQTVSDNLYSLTLTKEQQKSFASAKYYIMQKQGNDLYTKLFSSQNVQEKDGTITAAFDGNIIYGKNKFNEYFIPVADEHDSVGDITRYTLLGQLSTEISLSLSLMSSLPSSLVEEYQGYKAEYQTCRFHVALNNKTKNIDLSALLPIEETIDSNDLVNGRTEDIDLDNWTCINLYKEGYIKLTRDTNGVILPVEDWVESSYRTLNKIPIGDELEFVCEPLAGGTYYLIFEVEDTQGNKYCSELLPIDVPKWEQKKIVPDAVNVSWDAGDEIKLVSSNNVTVYLTKIKGDYNDRESYAVKAKNDNDFPVDITLSDFICNGNVCFDNVSDVLIVPGKSTVTDDYGISFGDAAFLISKIEKMKFLIKIENSLNLTTLLNDQEVNLSIGKNVAIDTTVPESMFDELPDTKNPCHGSTAEEQVVFQNNNLKISMIGCGTDSENYALNGIFMVENLNANNTFSIVPEAISLDGIYIPTDAAYADVYAGCTKYIFVKIYEEDLQRYGINSISNMKFLFRIDDDTDDFWFGGGETTWVDIRLSEKGSGNNSFSEGKRVIYDENEIRIALLSSEKKESSGMEWTFSVVNNTGKDIFIDLAELEWNGEKIKLDISVPVYFSENIIGANMSGIVSLDEYYYFLSSHDAFESMKIKLQIGEYPSQKILYTANDFVSFD